MGVVTLFIVAASRDYTSIIARWKQLHHQAGTHFERYGRTGAPSEYQRYREFTSVHKRLERAIDELLSEQAQPTRIYQTLDFENTSPNEISALLFVSHRFFEYPAVQRIRDAWNRMQHIQLKQEQLALHVHDTRRRQVDSSKILQAVTRYNALDREWNRYNRQLMNRLGAASLMIKRGGLWISVILGIILVLIGVVVTVRANKSIRRWEHTLNEKEVLLSEIHHRVKNNMAVISGLLELKSMQNRDPEQALRESRDRIHSMATIHEMLYQSNSFTHIDLRQYMQQLVDYICETHIGHHKKITLATQFDDIQLNINQAVPFGLFLNEVLTGITVHGFRGETEGKIAIELTETDGTVSVEITAYGEGLPEDIKLDNTDTSEYAIITALVQQLNAELNVETRSGVYLQCRFRKSEASGSSNRSL
ncbi:MAG: histidine kinase dimerization/phosphoacceptor domain -containing protein [Balneolaceae bacterium]|nr:histidine kinase dimerization/phosphoacceptor domain -containing protein [Balneolaceae bacterium]